MTKKLYSILKDHHNKILNKKVGIKYFSVEIWRMLAKNANIPLLPNKHLSFTKIYASFRLVV